MKTPTESYGRQCEWGEGWDAAQAQMSREFKDEVARSERLQNEYEILRHEIEQLKRQMKLRVAERDFAEKQLDRIREALV